MPVLRSDDSAEVKRLYRERVRLLHLLQANEAQIQVLGDRLDDRYDFRRKALLLNFETAQFMPGPPAPAGGSPRALPIPPGATPAPAGSAPRSPPQGLNPHAPHRKGPTSR